MFVDALTAEYENRASIVNSEFYNDVIMNYLPSRGFGVDLWIMVRLNPRPGGRQS